MKQLSHHPFPIRRDQRGGILVEAAFAIPLLVSLLCGILVYASWFMTAHSLQQAANEAARASVAGLNATERRTLVDASVTSSSANSLFNGATPITVATTENAGYYEVRLRYDLTRIPVFSATPIPLPEPVLERSAIVRIGG